MKTTESITYRNILSQIDKVGSRLSDARMQVATGKKLNKPSDNPASIRPVLNTRTQILKTERFSKALETTADKLSQFDSRLDYVENILARVKELGLAGVTETMNDDDRETIANEVAQLREELLDAANAKFDGKHVFSSFKEDTPPFSGTPLDYQGSDDYFMVEIAPGETLQSNLTGREVFGDASGSIFATLDAIETELRNDNTAGISAELTNLDSWIANVQKSRGKVGAIASRVDKSLNQMADLDVELREVLSRYEDVDLVEAITTMTMEEQAYKAALQVSAKVSQLSILNYFR